jgi:ankyrin repeat protein
MAAGEGNVEVLRFLISQGADVNKTDVEGNTPLFYALQGKGHS